MASDIVSALTVEDRKTIHDLLNNECTLRMPDALTDRFIDLGRVVTLRRRQCIIRRGDTDPDLYVIFEGIMRTWYRDGEQEVTQAFGTPGAICQSFHSYYNGEPSSVSFEACTPVRLLHVRAADFDALVADSAEFARWNLRLAQCQLYHYEVKKRVINGTARERYEAMLGHRPEIISSVPLKDIACYLGVTPAYLSRLRRQIIHDQRAR